ncbi:MAG: large-conductance mechanosensitive channel protein MscL [Bacteroidota bacterium]
MVKIIKEFKEFAIKGNVFDMAIGIIIGTAFSNVVSSLVKDIIMPPLGFFTGEIHFTDLKWVLQEATISKTGETQDAIAINYGSFIENSFDFLVVAGSIFLIIRLFNRLKSKAEDESNAEEVTPKNIELLAEIRDLLKENKTANSNSKS